MSFPAGSIIKIENYPLPQGPRPKYFIVLECSNYGLYNLLGMTTTNKSDFYFTSKSISVTYGSISFSNDPNFIFCFPRNYIIGSTNNFSFWEDTFILSEHCFREYNCEEINKFKPELLDSLKDNIYNDLLYCLYKSDNTKEKYRKILEPILTKINK
jgi:hypothetical protein